jgi:hypothetical protein
MLLALALLALALPLKAEERGGSLVAEPAFLVPMGSMGRNYAASLGYALDFDMPFSSLLSADFGADYTEMPSRPQIPDSRLQLIPTWLGVKVKRQWQPSVEYYGEVLAECIYQRSYAVGQGSSQELTTGGIGLAAGYDWWLSRWLLVGIEGRGTGITSNRRIHPFAQLGLRLGWRQ